MTYPHEAKMCLSDGRTFSVVLVIARSKVSVVGAREWREERRRGPASCLAWDSGGEGVGGGAHGMGWVGEPFPTKVRGAHADDVAAADGGYTGGGRLKESWAEERKERYNQD